MVNHVASELRTSTRLQTEAVKAADVWARLPAVVQRLSDTAMNTLSGADSETGSRTGKFLVCYNFMLILSAFSNKKRIFVSREVSDQARVAAAGGVPLPREPHCGVGESACRWQ